MQQTRQHILDILKEKDSATVDEIVTALSERIGDITAVTIRHHLEILRGDGLVAPPSVRRRSTPGRPQYVYALTDKALELFPNNYRGLATELLEQIRQTLPSQEVNVILEGVATQMAADAQIAEAPLPVRLNKVVEYLSEQGYNAHWEQTKPGYVIHTSNCPYHHLAGDYTELCDMDFRMIAALLGGIVPRRVGHIGSGDETCAYLVPVHRAPAAKQPDPNGAAVQDSE